MTDDERAPGQWTSADRRSFYESLLKVAWGGLTPREVKRLRKRHPVLIEALEKVVPYLD